MLWIPLNYQWKMPDILLVMKLIALDCAAAEFYVNGKYDILNLKEKRVKLDLLLNKWTIAEVSR
jgi:hypothetical protein